MTCCGSSTRCGQRPAHPRPARQSRVTSTGRKGYCGRPILLSSITAEIEAETGQAEWGKSCYEECRKLLQLEVTRLGDISENRGAVLVD
jgi:hypothetical protein